MNGAGPVGSVDHGPVDVDGEAAAVREVEGERREALRGY